MPPKILWLVLFVLIVAACGKRGDVQPPPGNTGDYPRVYPKIPTD